MLNIQAITLCLHQKAAASLGMWFGWVMSGVGLERFLLQDWGGTGYLTGEINIIRDNRPNFSISDRHLSIKHPSVKALFSQTSGRYSHRVTVPT